MAISFDPDKNAINMRKHGLPLQAADRFDWSSAEITVDDREDYGEVRFRAIGFLDAALYVLVFTDRPGNTRVISLRKAKPQERREYDEAVG